MPRWHCAQVRATLARFTLERGSRAGSSWCALWQSALEQPLAVNALAVVLYRESVFAVVAQRGSLPGAVALGAQGRHVARKGRGCRIRLPHGGVRIVAVAAVRRVRTALGQQLAVGALPILRHLPGVADGAVH